MNTSEKIAMVRKMFVHRTDTYLEQWIDTKGIHYGRKEEELTDDVILNHLTGKKTISSYAIREDDTVKWLCLDVDVTPKGRKELDAAQWLEETKQVVRQLVKLLFRLHIPFRVEQSGSKGFHVWVFFNNPVPASKAYLLGSFIEVYAPKGDYTNIEVFPKHRSFTESDFGFSVKIPLGIHRKTDTRCFFVNSSFEPYEDQWQVLSSVNTLTEARIDAIIEEEGIKDEVEDKNVYTPSSDYVCMSRIMSEGVDNGNRDAGFFQISCFLQSQGMPYPIAEKVLAEIPDHGDPPFGEEALQVKLESAYKKNYYPSPCKDSNIDSFCSSSCRRWNRKVENRWTKYGREAKDAVGNISRD